MARVTVEDCVDKVPNRFELVMLAAHRARALASGRRSRSSVTTTRIRSALREIADETLTAEHLRNAAIESFQRQIEVDEPEEDVMTLLSGNSDTPAQDDMSEERLLRALMEAQGES